MATDLTTLLFGTARPAAPDDATPSLLDLLFGQAGVTTPRQQAALEAATAQAQAALQTFPTPPTPAPVTATATPTPAGPVIVRTQPLTSGAVARLTLTPTPINLIHAWLATQSPGIAELVYVSAPLRVPAQGTATFSLPVPANTVLVQAEPLTVHSTYYHPGLLVTLLVDDFLIAADYALSASTASNLPEWTYVERVITAAYQNQSWRDAVVTNRGKAVAMRADVFQAVFLPLFNAVVAVYEGWAGAVTAQGRGQTTS